MEELKFNPTCLITGKKVNLVMKAIRDDNDNMIGWVFLHEDVKVEGLNAVINWEWKANVK